MKGPCAVLCFKRTYFFASIFLQKSSQPADSDKNQAPALSGGLGRDDKDDAMFSTTGDMECKFGCNVGLIVLTHVFLTCYGYC